MAELKKNFENVQNNLVESTSNNQQQNNANVMFRTECKEMVIKINPNALEQNINNAIKEFISKNYQNNQELGEKIMKIVGNQIIQLSKDVFEAFMVYKNNSDELSLNCKNFYDKEENDVNILTNSVSELYKTNQKIISEVNNVGSKTILNNDEINNMKKKD